MYLVGAIRRISTYDGCYELRYVVIPSFVFVLFTIPIRYHVCAEMDIEENLCFIGSLFHY
jgi:hypothetical protein